MARHRNALTASEQVRLLSTSHELNIFWSLSELLKSRDSHSQSCGRVSSVVFYGCGLKQSKKTLVNFYLGHNACSYNQLQWPTENLQALCLDLVVVSWRCFTFIQLFLCPSWSALGERIHQFDFENEWFFSLTTNFNAWINVSWGAESCTIYIKPSCNACLGGYVINLIPVYVPHGS